MDFGSMEETKQNDPAKDFLRRLDSGEIDRHFAAALEKLSTQHLAEVCEELVKRSTRMKRERNR
jgi:hypothetical protein